MGAPSVVLPMLVLRDNLAMNGLLIMDRQTTDMRSRHEPPQTQHSGGAHNRRQLLVNKTNLTLK